MEEFMIFFLEDDTFFSMAMKKNLKISVGESVPILTAYNVSQAKDVYEDNKKNIKCFIIDLNMRLNGLSFDGKTNEEIVKITRNGRISGWLWFEQFVLNSSDRKERFEMALFLTAYKNELIKHLNSGYNTSEFKEDAFVGKIYEKSMVQEKPDIFAEKVSTFFK